MKFQGDIIITDPMYILPHNEKGGEDWHACEYGENMEALGITTYITHDKGDRAGEELLDGDLFERGVRKRLAHSATIPAWCRSCSFPRCWLTIPRHWTVLASIVTRSSRILTER